MAYPGVREHNQKSVLSPNSGLFRFIHNPVRPESAFHLIKLRSKFRVVYQSEIVNGNKRVRVIIFTKRKIIYTSNIMRSFKKGLMAQKTGNLC